MRLISIKTIWYASACCPAAMAMWSGLSRSLGKLSDLLSGLLPEQAEATYTRIAGAANHRHHLPEKKVKQ